MKHLKDILNQDNIKEGLKLGSSKINQYTEHPKDWYELLRIVNDRIKKDPDADLNDIDVSEITKMYQLFDELDPHNIKIDQWDVSKVENFGRMFYKCENLKCDISNWNVSSGIYFDSMFYNCRKFDSDLSNWDMKSDKNHKNMFLHCGIKTEHLPKNVK